MKRKKASHVSLSSTMEVRPAPTSGGRPQIRASIRLRWMTSRTLAVS